MEEEPHGRLVLPLVLQMTVVVKNADFDGVLRVRSHGTAADANQIIESSEQDLCAT